MSLLCQFALVPKLELESEVDCYRAKQEPRVRGEGPGLKGFRIGSSCTAGSGNSERVPPIYRNTVQFSRGTGILVAAATWEPIPRRIREKLNGIAIYRSP